MSLKGNCVHGKTSNADIPRNRCGVGSPNTCPSSVPPLHPLNLVETRKAAKKGPLSAGPPAFPLCAKRLKCLNLFQRDEPFCHFFLISWPFFSLYGTSPDVLVPPC